MKILYMGTPDFAVGALQAILAAGHEVVCVVTQPDKAKGRSGQLQPPPVKECALAHGIPVLQPVKLRDGDCYDQLRSYGADLFVVAAFGQILPKEVLEMPRLGCINIHASLLPKYRGAAPIQWSILDGEEYTGVTIQQMNEGLDTGDILSVSKVRIEDEDTADSLFDKLCICGAALVVDTIPKLERGEITPIPQKEEESSYAAKLTKEYGRIDWSLSAKQLDLKVRGLNSWPSAYTFYKGKQLKIWKAKQASGASEHAAGTITALTKESFLVQTGDGALEVFEVQLEGKKRMSAGDFLRGMHLAVGEQFDI